MNQRRAWPLQTVAVALIRGPWRKDGGMKLTNSSNSWRRNSEQPGKSERPKQRRPAKEVGILGNNLMWLS